MIITYPQSQQPVGYTKAQEGREEERSQGAASKSKNQNQNQSTTYDFNDN